MRELRPFLVVAAVLVAGCGGSGPPKFDASDVAQAFSRATGDRLVSQPGKASGGNDVLALEGGDTSTALAERYGSFSIYVTDGGDAAKTLYAKDGDGSPVARGRDGVYWRRVSDAPPSWEADKVYRNVVLQWQAGRERKLTAGFRRVDAALSTLVGARVQRPPEDVPCAQQSITLDGERTGTCKSGAQTLVIANRGSTLTLPGLRLRGLTVDVRRRVASRDVGQGVTARGRFVVLRVRATNTGDRPLDELATELAIGPREYTVSDEALLYLQSRRPLPLQPGQSATVYAAFDVPTASVAAARKTGRLVLAPGGSDAASAPLLGVLRLASA